MIGPMCGATRVITMAHYAAVLFDMDGVIIDSHVAVTRFWQKLAAANGIRLSEADFTQFIYGRKAAYTLEQLFPDLSPASWQQALDELLAEEAVMTYVPIPGVLAFIAALRSQGVPLALVTSADPAKVHVVLDQLGLADAFQTHVTAQDVSRGKPFPEPYQLAADRLGFPSATCVVFEDSQSGAQAAVAAGAACVGVNTNPDLLLSVGARHVIPDFSAVEVVASAGAGLAVQLTPDQRLFFRA
jgi:HAD superfamily hydrolase (TIGR01509 family)